MLRILKPLEWWGKKINTKTKNFEIIRMVGEEDNHWYMGMGVGLGLIGIGKKKNCSSSFLLIFF